MAHIKLEEGVPGILGPLMLRPEIAKPMGEFTELLMRDDRNTLTRGERELIATYVSSLNDCFFCQNAHGALAAHYMQCDMGHIDAVMQDPGNMPITDKMKALLAIAGCVQQGGKHVTTGQVTQAKSLGITDMEIHDTVLIAAAFCMFNRYVDGLATWAPQDREFYVNRAARRAEEGYTSAPHK